MLTYLKKLSKTTFAAIAITSTTLWCQPSWSDGIFRPNIFKVRFYQIGLRDSATGALLPVFRDDNGIEYNLSDPNVTFEPPSSFSLTPGSYDQLYVLTSNTIKVSGNDGVCFTIAGANKTQNDGDWDIVQNGAAGAGEATITESGFNGGGINDKGPVNPAVAAAVNGSPTLNLVQWLVNSNDPTPGGAGVPNRYLFLGAIANPLNIDSTTNPKTVGITIDTSQSGRITGGCAQYRFQLTKFALTIKDS